MERKASTWRGVLWAAGAFLTSLLFALAAVCAISAWDMQRRLERRLAEPPLRLPVALSRPGVYGADWRTPDSALHGTEFELSVAPPFGAPPALPQRLEGFRGRITFEGGFGEAAYWPVAARDFTGTSQDIVRHDARAGAFLVVAQLHGPAAGRLDFVVEQPAPGLAGRQQVLEARPVMCPLSALGPIYVSWALAGISFVVAGVLTVVLVRARIRQRRGLGVTPL